MKEVKRQHRLNTYGSLCPSGRSEESLLRLLLCLAVLLTGCSRQDDAIPGDDHVLRPLSIASLAASTGEDLTGDASTRAALTDITTGEIGIFVAEDLANGHQAVHNRKGTYTGTPLAWHPDATPSPIWLNGIDASMAVYYPYDATLPDGDPLKLTAGPRLDAVSSQARDLWSTTFKANVRTEDISLVLRQLYSRLTVTFVKNADKLYTGAASLTEAKLAGVHATATYHPLTKTYTPAGAGVTTGTIAKTIGMPTDKEETKAVVDMLLIPAALTGDITLTATVDKKPMTLKLDKAKFANALTAGKQYTLLVELLPSKLALTTLSTKNWDESPAAVGGDASTVDPSEYIAPTIKGTGGYYFAPGNVIATKISAGNYTYSFGADQGYYSGVSNSGDDYFFWNVLAPLPEATGGSTTAWDAALDPCKKVGSGWQSPSGAIMTALAAADCPRYVGTYKRSDGSTVEGMYFGFDKQPDESIQDDYLFLPFAGMQVPAYGGSFALAPDVAVYWGDTQILNTEKGTGKVQTLNNFANWKSYAGSIRCVRAK